MKHWLAAGAVVFLAVGCSDSTGDNNQNTPAPGNIQAAIVNDNMVITWDSVPGATSYRVYMASEPGVKKSNLQQLANNMSHPDLGVHFDHPPGLNAAMEYFLVVTAVGPNGESIESCEVSATIDAGTGTSC